MQRARARVVTSPGPARRLPMSGRSARRLNGADFWRRSKEAPKLVRKSDLSEQIAADTDGAVFGRSARRRSASRGHALHEESVGVAVARKRWHVGDSSCKTLRVHEGYG